MNTSTKTAAELRIDALQAQLQEALEAYAADEAPTDTDSEEALQAALADTRGANGKGYRATLALFLQTGKLFEVVTFDTNKAATNAAMSYRNHADKHKYNVTIAQRGSRVIITNNAKRSK
jgi:hypothetical protein